MDSGAEGAVIAGGAGSQPRARLILSKVSRVAPSTVRQCVATQRRKTPPDSDWNAKKLGRRKSSERVLYLCSSASLYWPKKCAASSGLSSARRKTSGVDLVLASSNTA